MSRFVRVRRTPALFVLACIIIGCGDAERKSSPPGDGAPGASADAPAAPAGEKKTVLFVGTSLTAAYGLDPDLGFPARVQEKIDSAGLPWEAVNAGVSGETSRDARARMGWLLGQDFDVMVLETGANDMLRGTSLASLRQNLQAIIDTVRQAKPGTTIVLVGMLAPPNLGPEYTRDFEAVYRETAEKNGLPLIPFLLDGVGGHPELNLGDGMHPNERGQRVVAQNVWKVLEPVLRKETP